jgi:hypothetical protein
MAFVKNRQKLLRILLFMFFLVIFWTEGIIFLDSDFGWHLRIGQMIFNSGIPPRDPFSYTMPSYPFLDHEWLTDIVIAWLYSAITKFGLAFIFALLSVASFFVTISSYKKQTFIIPLFLALTTALSFSGIRPQVITWFFFSLITCLILNEKLWIKWRLIMPFLFLLWANLHGGVIFGLGAIFLMVTLSAFKKRRIYIFDFLVVGSSILITLVNPFGIGLWKEIWMAISEGSLRWVIKEFQPAIFDLNLTFWFFFSISIFMVIRYRKKFSFLELALYFGLLFAGIASVRNISIWLVVALPLTFRSLDWLEWEVSHFKHGLERFNDANKALFLIVFGVCLIQLVINYKSAIAMSEAKYFPEKAVKFLNKQLEERKIEGEIFSYYEWGGYLDWKLPEKKIFIDGRMAGWRQTAKDKTESEYALEEYINVLMGKIKFTSIARKYRITIVLVRNIGMKKTKTGITENLNKWWRNFQARFSGEKYFDIITQLKSSGWREIYKDDIAAIYENKTL